MQDASAAARELSEGGGDAISVHEKGFCVAMSGGGETRRRASRSVGDFLDMVDAAQVAWIDFVVENFEGEVFSAAKTLGFSELLVRNLLKTPKGGYEDLGNEVGILVPAISMDGFDVRLNTLLILIRERLIVTIHTTEVRRFFRVRRYAETLLRKIPNRKLQKDKISLLLIRILDENNSKNFDYLREIEEAGDRLSKDLADPRVSRTIIGPKIYDMKHALIIYLGGLWATVDTLNALRYGDADLMTDDPKILNRINALIGEVNSQIGLAEHMSEVLASGLEVLQSIYNNQLQILNNRLAMLVAYLTIIGTALLVPNTIATVASNTVFDLRPPDAPSYMALLLVSTLLATGFSWWAVKRMGLLPNSPD
ncbi:MAG: CorA family divalent cation transporter [Methanomicrobiales archaeon]|nr:CorA family divalent cation transporter [Methanomicrobiales archaeon]MDI6876630.1 CorA family divalent cation transporter [Methanomicrobiales archaeon]